MADKDRDALVAAMQSWVITERDHGNAAAADAWVHLPAIADVLLAQWQLVPRDPPLPPELTVNTSQQDAALEEVLIRADNDWRQQW